MKGDIRAALLVPTSSEGFPDRSRPEPPTIAANAIIPGVCETQIFCKMMEGVYLIGTEIFAYFVFPHGAEV